MCLYIMVLVSLSTEQTSIIAAIAYYECWIGIDDVEVHIVETLYDAKSRRRMA